MGEYRVFQDTIAAEGGKKVRMLCSVERVLLYRKAFELLRSGDNRGTVSVPVLVQIRPIEGGTDA